MTLRNRLLFGFLAGAAFLIGGISLNASTCDAAETGLKNKDRIVFLGDSITQAGARPDGYVSLVRNILKSDAADLEVDAIGAGISGNKVPDLEKRLDRDVLSKDPTIVVIYIGINDVWHSLQDRGTPKDEFEAGLRRIIAKIQDSGARVILATPSMIGEKTDGSNQLDKMLDQYSAVSRKVAADTDSQLLDLRKAFLDYLKEHNEDQKERGVLTSDGVHLNQKGNQFVAAQMVDALLGTAKESDVNENDKGLLRHVVLFQFKEDVSDEQVQEVIDAFAALPAKIDTIVDFEHGTDVSVEGKAAGFTHGFIVSFKDKKGRDIYLPHPAHQEFVKLVGPRLENVLVFDYFAK